MSLSLTSGRPMKRWPDVNDHDIGALGRTAQCKSLTDAGGGAGDNDGAVGEQVVWSHGVREVELLREWCFGWRLNRPIVSKCY